MSPILFGILLGVLQGITMAPILLLISTQLPRAVEYANAPLQKT